MSVYIPKREIIKATTHHIAKLSGYFEGEAYKCRELMNGRSVEIPGTRRQVILPSDNIVTNTALEGYGTVGYQQCSYFHVGTSSQAESAADEQLVTWVASQGYDQNVANNYAYTSGSAPYYGAARRKARFVAGFAGGNININEMGVGPSNTNVTLSSRALTRDVNGDPTTVTVLADEYLDLWYTRRIYPTHINEQTGAPVDGTGTIDISGTSYDYWIRPAIVTSAYPCWGSGLWTAFVQAYGAFSLGHYYGSDSVLGPVTGSPIASSNDGNGTSDNNRLLLYATGTYTRSAVWQAGLTRGNVTGGIKAMLVGTSMGAYQVLLSAAVPKNGTNIFEYTQSWTWMRKV